MNTVVSYSEASPVLGGQHRALPCGQAGAFSVCATFTPSRHLLAQPVRLVTEFSSIVLASAALAAGRVLVATRPQLN